MTDTREKLQLTLLGELGLRRAGCALPLPASRKTRALLAFLALNPRAQRRDSLCELLWQDTDDPRAALRWSLSKLRALLGDALASDRDSIELRRADLAIDLDETRALLGDQGGGDPARLRQLEAGLDAGYLPGIDCAGSSGFELWLQSERAALRTLHGQMLAQLQQLSRDDPARAIHFARKRVGIDATSLPANLALLSLLLRHEGQPQARTAMEQCRQRLCAAQLDDAGLLRGWRDLSAARQARETPAKTGPELQLPGKPSLAVLGFREIGGDEHSVLGLGLTADLISRLSRVGGLFVIARASSTRFAAGQQEFPDIARLLGVRYLIHGTIQSQGQRVKVNVELVDGGRGREVWVESFARARDDLFLLQDELANAVVAAVEPAIERAEYELARLKPPASLDAWENYHMALWHSFRFTAGDTEDASSYLQRALALDPHFSRAHAAMSLTHFSRAFLDTGENATAEIALARASAERSVDLDNRDAMGHWSLGRAQFLAQQHDLALVSLQRALQVNPNYAQGHYARGFVSLHSGIPAEAIPELEAAQRLSPFDPLLFAMISSRAVSLALQGKFEEAATLAVRATLEANAHFHIYAIAAACLELAGRHEEARRNVQIALQRHSAYSRKVFFRSFPYKLPAQQEIMDSALARAGLPSGR
jgi:TolB-like protein/DNA-binding SARP family transcriptional activator